MIRTLCLLALSVQVHAKLTCSPSVSSLRAWCDASCNLVPTGCFSFCNCVATPTFDTAPGCSATIPATVDWCLATCRAGSCPDSLCSDGCNPFSLTKLSLTTRRVINGFAAPESVAYDATRDVYFAGSLTTNFISKFDPNTGAFTQNFCATNQAGPSTGGVTVFESIIYAAAPFSGLVHRCNADTGAYLGAIDLSSLSPISLNDIAADPSTGKIYVTDAAFTLSGTTLVAQNTIGIFQIDTRNGNAVSRVALPAVPGDIQNANGILVLPDSILVSNNFLSATPTILQLTKSATPKIINKFSVPAGVDGITAVPNRPHVFLINGQQAIFALDISNGKVQNLATIPCADIAFDTKRNLVLCPTFGDIATLSGSTVTSILLTDSA
eukprot:c10234_g1_i1.p1 GENE.c10234_g1_i1~~c10234_g1_i1.p1  ORF type:complete len:382 (+),score=61.71 c10234_g1_i1:57-1202(+)